MAIGKGEQLTFALGQFDRLQSFFSRVEGRARFLWATDIAMAAVVVSNLSKATLHSLLAIPAALVLAALGFSLAFLVAVSHSHLKNTVRPSMIYFGDISRVSAETYIDNIRAADEDELLNDALCQVWRNAEILTMKFRRVHRAFVALCVALPLWLLFLGWVVIQTGGLPMFAGK